MKKKLLLSAFIATASLGLAGCGNENKNEKKDEQPKEQKVEEKKLTCTMTEEEDNSTDTIKYTFTFNGDTYSKAVASVSSKYSSEDKAKKEYEKASKEVKDANDNKGVTANAQSSGTLVSVTYTFTVSDLDDKAKKLYEEVGLEELDGKSYDSIKSILETATFKCS